MSCLFWNCRGLGNLRTEKELGELIQVKDPSVVFLTETWADEARLKKIKRDFDFCNMFFVDRNNQGSGLVMY